MKQNTNKHAGDTAYAFWINFLDDGSPNPAGTIKPTAGRLSVYADEAAENQLHAKEPNRDYEPRFFIPAKPKQFQSLDPENPELDWDRPWHIKYLRLTEDYETAVKEYNAILQTKADKHIATARNIQAAMIPINKENTNQTTNTA